MTIALQAAAPRLAPLRDELELDMPTAEPPMIWNMRISAGVSKEGPEYQQ